MDTEAAAWRLVHHFLGSPCGWGVPLTRRPRRFGRREPSCPVSLGSDVASELAPAVTKLLARRGIDYDPAGPSHAALWCLGGPELYRTPADAGDIDADGANGQLCLDLNLRVCDEHRTISLELFPYDLVPEWGGSGPDDLRKSDPIELASSGSIVDQVIARLEAWLDEILVLPK